MTGGLLIEGSTEYEDLPPTLAIAEVSRLTHLHPSTVRADVKNGLLPTVTPAGRRRRVVERHVAVAYMRGQLGNTMTDAIVVDAERTIVWIAPWLATALGYDPADMTGKPGGDFTVPDGQRDGWYEALAAGETVSGTSVLRGADGQLVPLAFRAKRDGNLYVGRVSRMNRRQA